jgi:hypothetical protein
MAIHRHSFPFGKLPKGKLLINSSGQSEQRMEEQGDDVFFFL